MSISFGQALGIIGGIPILKNALGHTVDHLKIPRHLDVGSAGTASAQQSLLGGVLSGAAPLLQSPLGSSLSSLTSTITNATASLTSAGGAGALVTALGSLQTSATNLSALADNIVGVGSSASYPTQLDVIGHVNAAQSLGSALPTNLSLATVLAPVSSSQLMASTQASVTSLVAAVVAGTTTVAAAVTTTTALQSALDAVTNASTNAVATVAAAQTSLCAAQSAIALLVAGPPEMVAAMKIAIQPGQMAAVQAIIDAHMAAIGVAAESQAAASAAATAVAEAVAANTAQRPALSS